jgi:hypothetical protein
MIRAEEEADMARAEAAMAPQKPTKKVKAEAKLAEDPIEAKKVKEKLKR